MFCEAWCNHPLCTAHNRTPHQLWILGMARPKIETPNSTAVPGVTGITVKKLRMSLKETFTLLPSVSNVKVYKQCIQIL